MCGITDHGYIVRYDGNLDGVKTMETYFNFSEYARKALRWSVESYVGEERSAKIETSVELCNFDQPEKPVLSSKFDVIVTLDKEFVFSWTNPSQNKEDMCGVKLNYTYGVSTSLDGEYEDFKNVSDTNVTRTIKTGAYNLSVITSNGIFTSDISSVVLRFCVPEDIPYFSIHSRFLIFLAYFSFFKGILILLNPRTTPYILTTKLFILVGKIFLLPTNAITKA